MGRTSQVNLSQLAQDARYGLRGLIRAPGFTAVAAVTLALGIGGNLAIFSVVNAVLLRPLDYKDSDRLVTLLHGGSNPVAPANYLDWRDQSHSFQSMGAAQYWGANITQSDPPEHLIGMQVTENLLPMLGVQPLVGRLFAAGEEHTAVLSYRLWIRRFGADRNIVGKQITLDSAVYTVVGVMPSGFQFAPFWATRAELWVPLPLASRLADRGGNSLRVFARLQPGVSLGQAQAEITSITHRLERQFPGSNRDVAVTPLKENVVGKVRTPLLLVLGAVGFVLLIACANVAHMVLARTSDRRKEIAVRTALGASRSRVILQIVTENVLLSALAAALGLLFAFAAMRGLMALRPANLPRIEHMGMNSDVLFFLLGMTVLTAILSSLAPAFQATGLDLNDSLKEGGRGDSDGPKRNRLRGFLIASEFALAFALLAGAGLVTRSFLALRAADAGFDPNHLFSLVVSVAGSKEGQPNQAEAFYRSLLQKVRTLPGVEFAAGINHLPLAGDMWGWHFAIEGRPPALPADSPSAVYRVVTPHYFETMRLPIRRGRDINESDNARSVSVVVINERAARKYWPGEDPIGQRILVDQDGVPSRLNVIGIVKDAKQSDWAQDPLPEIYLAAWQNAWFLGANGAKGAGYLTLVARTSGEPADSANAITNAVWSFDRNLPISQVVTMNEVIAEATAESRFEMLLLSVFAAVALMLAAVGIYGVMNYAIARRTREIGIRMSLGASRGDIVRMVLNQGMAQALIGAGAGAAGALLFTRLLTGMLYGVHPADPLTFLVSGALLAFVAALACCIPARRATRVEPLTALRSE